MISKIYKIKNKLFSFLVLLLFFAFQSFLFAQSGGVKGQVQEIGNGDPLIGANIVVKGTTLGSSSDFDGKYIIRNIPVGKQTIEVSYIGYEPVQTQVDIVANRVVELNFNLKTQTLQGETVTISAQSKGQISAIQQQLSSDKISNIVSEERIQQLPDFNAASVLSRLPGISTQQSSGEDSKVVIRGLSPKYNSIEVEGVKLSATGSSQIGLSSNPNSGGTGVSNDRSVDLTMVSPYMIRMISVYKSLTPDMNANSIGGTVNMELREAPSDFHWNLMYQQGYTAKSNTFGNFRAVVSGSNRFFNDKLGVYALFNAESYDRNSDNMDASYNIAGEEVEIDSVTGYRPVKVSSVTFNRHLETRKRYGGNLILDYNIPNGSIKFINLLARINSDYTEHRQTINYDAGRMEWQLRKGENITDQQMHTLKFDYDLGFINTDLSASYTSSNNLLDKSPVINLNQVDALQSGVPRDNKVPEDLTYLLTKYRGDSSVVLRSADLFSSNYKEEKYTYKADFEIPFNLGNAASGYFKFGGQIYNQTNSTDQETPYVGFNGSSIGEGQDIQSELMRSVKDKFGITVNELGDLIGTTFLNSDNELFNSFLNDKYGEMFYVSNPDLLVDILDYIVGNPNFDASNSQVSTGSQGGWYDGPYQQLTNDYKYKEDYYAAYGMSKINFLDFMLIGGVRYEKVESEYFAYNARDMRNAQAQKMYDTTSVNANEFILPMVQVKYSPFDWMDVRYAYTQTLSRPDYSQLSPKFTITQGNYIYSGNPNLKPAKAYNHDVNFTFHANKLGLITVGGFYKTLQNFVYTASYQLDAAEKAGVDGIDNYTIVRDGANVVIPQTNATVVKPYNNPNDATIKGLELDFQHSFWYLPSPLNNIVIGVNYANITSETKYPWYDVKVVLDGRTKTVVLIDSSSTGRLIDQPNQILNFYVGYDYEGFSSRLSFLFQDNSARGNGGRYPENDSYTTKYFRIDFAARQKLPYFNSELFLDISNINNANTSWIQRSTEGFRGIQNYGLTANFGVRVTY
ncbi:MAG: TonB-dependent receptor [Bacteroidetes bacterium]|nr:TonB-dependent receptor [Bacteroidota bacterium]MBU1117092.1 TonB-dependent receptor [Bacteroidota bacterium]MBU1797220.1 TonB-dependent receptor [Bacteroidota bacterium]